MENMEVDLEELVGTRAGFYGAHSNIFKLGRTCYEVLEDEDDGYRSMLDHVQEVKNPGGFFTKALATIEVKDCSTDDCVSYQLVDTKDGHVWLEFGTNNYDDYYPCFVFNYTPKAK